MKRFLKSAGSVILVLFLALAWPGTNLLKEFELVSREQQVGIFVLLILALALQQTYLVLPKPVGQSFVEERRRLADALLQSLLADYYKEVKEKPLPKVRANVMLLTKGALGVFGPHLTIRYHVHPKDSQLLMAKANSLSFQLSSPLIKERRRFDRRRSQTTERH